MDPHELGFGPIDQNIFTWTEEQRKAIRPLPRSLQEALEALERDHDFMLQGGVFDEGQIAEWVKVKYEEHYAVRNRPHPFEMELYFDS
jgi:glutamine synthetase